MTDPLTTADEAAPLMPRWLKLLSDPDRQWPWTVGYVFCAALCAVGVAGTLLAESPRSWVDVVAAAIAGSGIGVSGGSLIWNRLMWQFRQHWPPKLTPGEERAMKAYIRRMHIAAFEEAVVEAQQMELIVDAFLDARGGVMIEPRVPRVHPLLLLAVLRAVMIERPRPWWRRRSAAGRGGIE